MKNSKIVIDSHEIGRILGISLRHAQRQRKLIMDAFNKQAHQELTYKEFASYTGIPLEEVLRACKHH